MSEKSNIELLQQFYQGFYLTDPVGNNAFSFDKRQCQEIYVPPIIQGTLQDLKIGKEVAFCEHFEQEEIRKCGLQHFLYLEINDKEIFVFDNHNHAFFFWIFGVFLKKWFPRATLWHVDQHSDMRKPDAFLQMDCQDQNLLQKAFKYTNFVLNVGNFIQPALSLDLFSHVEIISSLESFQLNPPEHFILDIDLDIFAKDMEYIPSEYKIEKIREYIDKSNFITIATSPYFIEQEKAIGFIKKLLQ
ncbi:MAG: UPF0489 family protein [Candidatus Omnitrophica bacterium]|nr:UPF0489 family protein [Candidatus Omnitrophota bacterium]MCB9748328.1 UPF0489 family protein [Candidatus Omnitrophota bacterium]